MGKNYSQMRVKRSKNVFMISQKFFNYNWKKEEISEGREEGWENWRVYLIHQKIFFCVFESPGEDSKNSPLY